MRDESEKEVIHRLEAFSDIVIGFSLAQLALSLTIPAHTRDLFAHVRGAASLLALVVTFGLVCAVWWSHHRLFRHLFVPTPVNIFANFAALGGVIFLAYSMQVLVRFSFEDRIAYAMYTGSYAWILLLFASMAWNGMRLRSRHMNEELRINSKSLAVRMTIIGVWLLIITVLTGVFGVRPEIAQWMFVVLVVPLFVQRLVSRAQLRSISRPSA